MQGSGSNVRPLKWFAPKDWAQFGINDPRPPQHHLSRAGSFTNQNKPSPITGHPPSFSQYKTKFTTIRLKKSVQVSGEFWVGILIDVTRDDAIAAAQKGYYLPDNGKYYVNGKYDFSRLIDDQPWGEVGISALGVCLVDLKSTFQGINYKGLRNVETGKQLKNNRQFTTGDLDDRNPVLGGFFPTVATAAFTNSNVGSFQDEFYAIRAIPAAD